MAKLYFKVGSDWEEVVRLRNEIAKLKQELMSMDGTQPKLEQRWIRDSKGKSSMLLRS